MKVFGIDFGTTNTCISYYENDSVKYLFDDKGFNLIPTRIYIEDNIIYIGNNILPNMPYISDIKRFIGYKYNDPIIQEYIKYYNIEPNEDNEIIFNMRNIKYTISDLVYLFFLEIYSIIKNTLSTEIIYIVLTVPAYFNDIQRCIIKNQVEKAGFNILKIINEPTSAAICYFDNNKSNNTIMVYDLGGGTLDITILRYNNEIYDVIETIGHSHLGGSDFDNKIVDYCINYFSRKNNIPLDNINTFKYINKLKPFARECKEKLSFTLNHSIYIDCFYGNMDLNINITKTLFEQICNLEFNKCITILNKLNTKFIDKIILVGGSTRMNNIKTLLSNYYKNTDILSNINPDYIVSMGACIIANKLISNTPIVLFDVVALPIGVETSGDIMTNIIEKNTKLPCKIKKIFTTEYDNQPSFNLNIFEGEYSYAKQNNLLGTITVNNLPCKKKGDLRIIIKFKIDHNGLLIVSVKCDNIKVTNSFKKSNLNTNINTNPQFNQIIEMIKFKEYLINRNYYYLQHNINNDISNKIQKLISWLNDCINLKNYLSIESINKMKIYIENLINDDIICDTINVNVNDTIN